MYTLNPVTRKLPNFKDTLKAAINGVELDHDQLVTLIQANTLEERKSLQEAAGKLTQKMFGNKVFMRGIVEFSNACEKRCNYCGVTAYDQKFLISQDSILECCDYMYKKGYRNLVLQSGEVTSDSRINWICELLDKINEKYTFKPDVGMCVVLSIGELLRRQYQKLYDHGAKRYLLRIESSNKELYQSMHPPDHLFERRLECLRDLKEIGFVTGTGVMVGVPRQTFDHLAQDVAFFRDNGFHMIGLGPYVIHKDTVMGKPLLKIDLAERKKIDQRKVEVTLNMYNVIRLQCPYVNIAATTALEALNPGSKELALTGGSNVLMPIITPKQYRSNYQLYEGKKEIDMDREQTHQMVIELLKKIGKVPEFNRWNHPPLFMRQHKFTK
ncbi:radical SAM domain containing protein [Histomonas meleagridis]|uniref:radical SAM domain containing protein n=1 Tax=Histomonas meleagridis TaxID=135588 RepID=UPI0035595740|nr:radical SAM domain containing protein [Histomonas meleagridis]KAH0803314.1 radical SAM domain containing protein [Histomonas meleagridis]